MRPPFCILVQNGSELVSPTSITHTLYFSEISQDPQVLPSDTLLYKSSCCHHTLFFFFLSIFDPIAVISLKQEETAFKQDLCSHSLSDELLLPSRASLLGSTHMLPAHPILMLPPQVCLHLAPWSVHLPCQPSLLPWERWDQLHLGLPGLCAAPPGEGSTCARGSTLCVAREDAL